MDFPDFRDATLETADEVLEKCQGMDDAELMSRLTQIDALTTTLPPRIGENLRIAWAWRIRVRPIVLPRLAMAALPCHGTPGAKRPQERATGAHRARPPI